MHSIESITMPDPGVKQTDLRSLLSSAANQELLPSLIVSKEQALRYEAQHRDGEQAYARYFSGMDRTMQQKVALCAVHFSTNGIIADMGSGSGKAGFDLASLYPEMFVVGIDIANESITHARATYRRSNLAFVLGDVSSRVLPLESLDGILNSSILHHVTSFNDFDIAHIDKLLDNQIAQLRTGGKLVIRDFVIPQGPDTVVLELPDNDQKEAVGVLGLSTSDLFAVFARDFRSSLHQTSGVPFESLPQLRPGFARFKLSLRDAAEFILRKDYRDNWSAELREEYTYMTQQQFIEAFQKRGLRVLQATEIFNPWIVENRFEGKVFLSSVNGLALAHIPTNFVIVGEKVTPTEGVGFKGIQVEAASHFDFCYLRAFRDKISGKTFELVGRPNQTIDLTPWFRTKDCISLIVKEGFPRPIVTADTGSPNLDRSYTSGYLVEPLSVTKNPNIDLDQILANRAGIDPQLKIKTGDTFKYFSSPGGVDELIIAADIELALDSFTDRSVDNYTGFAGSGRVKALDARQILRSCQVGSIVDNRTEINAYRILMREQLSVGPWIGVQVDLKRQPAPEPALSRAVFAKSTEQRRIFSEIEIAANQVPEFLSLKRAEFVEYNAAGKSLATKHLEFITPIPVSDNTISTIPVARNSDGEILIGLEERDLPAPQIHNGSSLLYTCPAFRLPRKIQDLDQARAYASQRLTEEFGVNLSQLQVLGGKYYSSPGVSNEVVYVYLAEVDLTTSDTSKLHWVKLLDLVKNLSAFEDGHLITGALRASHALGLL